MCPLLYDDLRAAIEATGLDARGGFNADDGELPPAADGRPGRVARDDRQHRRPLLASASKPRAAMRPDPLDNWVKRVVDPLAATLGARACHPNDRPYQPFQRWAQRIEAVHGSPLGILIHPVYGLWHAYRAALVFAEPIGGLPKPDGLPSPCDDLQSTGPAFRHARSELSPPAASRRKPAPPTCAVAVACPTAWH